MSPNKVAFCLYLIPFVKLLGPCVQKSYAYLVIINHGKIGRFLQATITVNDEKGLFSQPLLIFLDNFVSNF